MNVALLCPGPSLLDTYRPGDHDVTLGVNRAVLAVQCDWWVFVDWQTFLENEARLDLSRMGIFCSGTAAESLRRHGQAGRLAQARHLKLFEDLDRVTREWSRWSLYSATAGLMLAASLGAVAIDVYGADWTDQPDFDGHRAERDRRDDARWESERAVWSAVTEHLAEQGISTQRVQLRSNHA